MMIRQIKETELDQLTELYFHYTKKEELPTLSKEEIKRIWAQIELNPCVTYFVIEEENKIAGSCIITITPSFIRGGYGYGLIEHVVIHSDYRRRGYGKAIVNHALTYAWEKGCTEVMLLSGSHNKRAHTMYEQIGFDKNRKKGFIMYKPK